MSKLTERLERLLLFSTLVGMLASPLCCYSWASESLALARTFIALFCATAGLGILYATLVLCYRGFVPSVPTLANAFSTHSTRGCFICMQFKPERSHHCSKCRKCVRKMDHHCHWLGRCINYDNLGHFCRFLLFTLLSNAMLFTYNCRLIIQSVFYSTEAIRRATAVALVVTTPISALLVCITAAHFFYQLTMICRNVTNIEMMKRHNIGFANAKCADSIYDIGVYNNLVDVFGPAKYLFLGMPRGDGMNFRRRADATEEDNELQATIRNEL